MPIKLDVRPTNMKQYNEEDELYRYVWLIENDLIPTEYVVMKRLRSVNESSTYKKNEKDEKTKQYKRLLSEAELCSKGMANAMSEKYKTVDLEDLDEVFTRDLIAGMWGKIKIARCGKCNRILESKSSIKCMWCGSDLGGKMV